MALVPSSFMNKNIQEARIPYRQMQFFERVGMKQKNKRWLFLLLIILVCCAFYREQAHAEIDLGNIFVLTPDYDTATKDYINYSPADSLEDVTYFLVIFTGFQTAIQNFTIKLSSSPMFKEYTGSVTYSLVAVGYPNIYCAKGVTATNSTVASNNIKATFAVNVQFGFALIGATVNSRHNVDSDVKMSIRFEIQ